ncbi:ATP-binding protein [Shewanella baltica]|uniref:ATP-binding protein n=1 Tax=Shewanella baltica TaxID=62322 RepID=UPI00217E1C59|nr:ATP-binding protein [Shewanella baltica]MCS6096492.1 AAA family ATPase [Shewanella baltica]MCS6227600.1 AAA family ATPase [Shewanella baltica]
MSYRLIYLKVANYKNIKDRDVRFTLDYEISEDETKKKLIIEKTAFYKTAQLGKNPLAHLDVFTALVGANGSGKSNLIELISYIYTTGMFPDGLIRKGDNSYALIEQNVDGVKSFFCVTPSLEYHNEKLSNSENVAFCTELTDYNEFGKTILYHPLNDLSAGTSSNVVFNSEKIASNPFKKLTSGTTDSKLATKFAINAKNLARLDVFKHISENEHSNLVLLFSDFKSAIENDLSLQEQFSVFSKRTAQVKLYNAFIEDIKSEKNSEISFILIYAFLITFSAVQHNKRYTDVPYLVALMVAFSMFTEEVEFIKPYRDDLDKYVIGQQWEAFRDEIFVYVRDFRDRLNLFSLEYNELNGSYLSVPLSDVIEENEILDLICSNDWFDLPNQKRVFQGAGIPLKIDGLSSGEISAIHYLNELYGKIREHGETSLVILDEPENSFHPEWQRLLISILDEMYEDLAISPQTIISSHSPFILSDTLSGKVVFLGEERGLENCFAANIHDLLSNGFFLTQTIGGAAQKELLKVVDFINNPEAGFAGADSLSEKIEIARVVINQVGDKVLQKELNRKIGKLELSLSPISKELAALLAFSESNPNLKLDIRELTQKYIINEVTDV